jgi:hypothetical protein
MTSEFDPLLKDVLPFIFADHTLPMHGGQDAGVNRS